MCPYKQIAHINCKCYVLQICAEDFSVIFLEMSCVLYLPIRHQSRPNMCENNVLFPDLISRCDKLYTFNI